MRRSAAILFLALAAMLSGGWMWRQQYQPVAANAAPAPWYLSGGIEASACIAAYQAKGAASAAESYTNLANPGVYTLTGDPPSWNTTTGWLFTAVNKYMTTGWYPSNPCTIMVRFSGVVNEAETHCAMGSSSAAGGYRCNLFPVVDTTGNSAAFGYGQGNSLYIGYPVTSGVMVLSGTNAYVNGVLVGGCVDTSLTMPSPEVIHIGCRLTNTGREYYMKSPIQAAAIYNRFLTSNEVFAVSTAINAL